MFCSLCRFVVPPRAAIAELLVKNAGNGRDSYRSLMEMTYRTVPFPMTLKVFYLSLLQSLIVVIIQLCST